MPVIISAITSKLAGPIALAGCILLAALLAVSSVKLSVVRGELKTAQNSVGQLKGSLAFQNLQVSQLGTESAEATARAKSALAASRAAHAGDATRAQALVSAPVPHDPVAACDAADQSIKMFFDPQPKGAT